MTEPDFIRIERRFLHLVSQPRPVADAAAALAGDDSAAFPLCQWIDAPDEQVAAMRLGIYSHMYFARLRDSLREDFAAFAAQIPPLAFDRLAVKYLSRHPSRNPSLRYHGQRFAEFLAQGLRAREPEFLELRADSAALCQVEWARIEAFDAPEAPLLQRDDLARLGAEAWGALFLRAVPSVRLLTLDFAVNELWCAIEAGQPVTPLREESEQLLIFRRGFRVYQRAVFGAEAQAIASLRKGATFSEICACFAEQGSLEESAERALAALLQWLADELLTLPAADPFTRTD